MRALSTKTNVTAPGGDYPHGRIKDNPGDNTGTPVNELLYGDFHQFFERLMFITSTVANGLPENSAAGFQLITALQALIQSYIDALKGGVPAAGDTLDKLYDLITAMGRPRGGWDASSNTVPGSATNEAGDFWRITVAGTLSGLVSGAGDVKPGDVLIADVDGATNQGDFYCIQSNVDQATASVLGLVKLYVNVAASNTDGGVTQAALVTALAGKADQVGVSIATKVVQIGDWDMDANATTTVAHGIADFKKIRSIAAMIRDDADNLYSNLMIVNFLTAANTGGNVGSPDATNITLARITGGFFDGTDYNSTGFNRGWLTITYEL